MWKRRQLKRNAKSALRRNYWRCVLAAVILASITGSFSGGIVNAKGETVSTEVGSVSVPMDDTSSWVLTADTYSTEFNGSPENVFSNGHTLYVNGVALKGVTP